VRFNLVSGILAGVAAGLVLGTMLTIMAQELAGDGFVTLMDVVARNLGSERLAVAWLVELAVSAGLGAVFGLLAGRRMPDAGAVASRALFFGLVLWVATGLVAVPELFGVSPLAVPGRRDLWPWMPALLIGWLLFASVLAGTFTWLGARRRVKRAASAPALRRAA
jgi:hypothetical protein